MQSVHFISYEKNAKKRMELILQPLFDYLLSVLIFCEAKYLFRLPVARLTTMPLRKPVTVPTAVSRGVRIITSGVPVIIHATAT